jgi:hypothetical protein
MNWDGSEYNKRVGEVGMVWVLALVGAVSVVGALSYYGLLDVCDLIEALCDVLSEIDFD